MGSISNNINKNIDNVLFFFLKGHNKIQRGVYMSQPATGIGCFSVLIG